MIVWCGFTSNFILDPFSLKGLHQGDQFDVPWRLQVTKTSLYSVWFLPCKNVIVLRPLFLCRMGQHRKSVAKFNVCFVKPSQKNASSPEVFQILSLQDLLTWIHVASGYGDTWRIIHQGNAWFLVDLKTSTQRHVVQIPRELRWATIDHAILRMQHVVESSGAHIENIL